MIVRALGALALLAAVGVCTGPFRQDADSPASASHRMDGDSPAAAAKARVRDDALRRARTRLGPVNRAALTTPPPDPRGTLTRDFVSCDFVARIPGGTTPKFDCKLPDGEVVKVKYTGPEPYGEVAASRLLRTLGFGADRVSFVKRVQQSR